MSPDLEALAFQLRQEFAAQRQQDLRAMQDAIVRLQDAHTQLQQWMASVALSLQPLPATPTLNLNVRPRN